MKNVISYYYGINIINLFKVNNKLYFNYKNNDYFFIIFDRPIEEAQGVYNLFLELKKRKILSNSIIVNKNNQIITFVNNYPYILIRDDIRNRLININDFLYIQSNTYNIFWDRKLDRKNWIKMWKAKIDYYENHITSLSSKYDLLNSYMDYYIGLGENAISYLVNSDIKEKTTVLSHKRIYANETTFDFYNPLNYVLDSRVRDISEYIKNMFFYSKIDYDFIICYLNYSNFSRDEYVLFISRMLFPTYYFDIYDKIVLHGLSEDAVYSVIDKTDDFIQLIRKIMIYVIIINHPLPRMIFTVCKYGRKTV